MVFDVVCGENRHGIRECCGHARIVVAGDALTRASLRPALVAFLGSNLRRRHVLGRNVCTNRVAAGDAASDPTAWYGSGLSV